MWSVLLLDGVLAPSYGYEMGLNYTLHRGLVMARLLVAAYLELFACVISVTFMEQVLRWV